MKFVSYKIWWGWFEENRESFTVSRQVFDYSLNTDGLSSFLLSLKATITSWITTTSIDKISLYCYDSRTKTKGKRVYHGSLHKHWAFTYEDYMNTNLPNFSCELLMTIDSAENPDSDIHTIRKSYP